jgi:hypothetical protein
VASAPYGISSSGRADRESAASSAPTPSSRATWRPRSNPWPRRTSYREDSPAHALPLLLDLFDVYRYLGRAAVAADVADELAAGSERDGDIARFYERQAAILRAGEPRLRVIARI